MKLKRVFSLLCGLLVTASITASMYGDHIHEAAEKGNLEKVKELIKNGSDVNAKAQDPFLNSAPPLLLAAENGHLKVVRVLIKNGADVNVKDDHDWTPLHKAVKNGYIKMARILIGNGADVNAKYNGYTPLDMAKRDDLAKLLKKHGAKKASEL